MMTPKTANLRAPSLEAAIELGDLSASFVDAIRSTKCLAIDLETSGLDPRACEIGTCQLFVPGGGDPRILRPNKRPERLVRLIEDPSIQKIFHHAMFDLSFLRAHWDARAANVKCTKVSSRILNPTRPNHSLADLLKEHLGVTLNKDPNIRTSDWSMDRLSAEQIQYAVGDVIFLPELMERLGEKLRFAGRWSIAKSAFDFLPANVECRLLGIPDVFAY